MPRKATGYRFNTFPFKRYGVLAALGTVTGSITPGGPAVTVTIVNAGDNAALTFSGTANERVYVDFSSDSIGSGCCGATVSLLKPDGSTLVTKSAQAGASPAAYFDTTTLPVDGTYMIAIQPANSATGSITVRVYDVPGDVSASVTPSQAGASVTVTTSAVGQNASVTFAGSAGQRVYVNLTNDTIGRSWPNSDATVELLRPDGSLLADTGAVAGSSPAAYFDTTTLPTTGTYTLFVDPSHAYTGSITLIVYDVPADVTGSLTPSQAGASVTVTTSAVGQNASVTFAGSAGQRIYVNLTSDSIGPTGTGTTVRLYKPDGSSLIVTTAAAGSSPAGAIDTTTLPAGGTYSLFVDPPNTKTGSLTLTVYDVPADVTGSLTPSQAGASVTVTTSAVGQNASVTFAGSAGQRIYVNLTSDSIGPTGTGTTVRLYKPDGSSLIVTTAAAGSSPAGAIDTTTLPAGGTYSLFVDPPNTKTGSLTLTVYDVPADASGTLWIGGSALTLTTTVPGQNMQATFTGTAGEPVVITTGSDSLGSGCCTATLALLKPDGTTAVSGNVSSSGSTFNATLAATGVYKITVNPPGISTGSLLIAVGQAGGFLPDGQAYGPCDGGVDALNPTGCVDDVETGIAAYTAQATDARLAGIGVPFSFVRSYTSADPTVGRLGRGWTDNLAESLQVQGNGDVLVHAEDGQQVYFARQSDGSYASATGALSTLSYTGSGYLLVRSDQTRLQFNAQGQLTGESDRNNQGLSLSYDGSGLLSAVTDAAGRVVTFSSNADGTLRQLTLPDGRQVSFMYANGLLSSVTDLRGGTTSYTYDAGGRLATIVDADGHTAVQNSYDGGGRFTRQLDALGHVTTYSWNAGTQTETVTDPRGGVTTDTYNSGVLVKRVDPLGNTTTYGYSGANDLTSVNDPRGNTTTFTYDSRHNKLTETAPSPLSYRQTWTYDSFNDVLTYTDERGNPTSYGYDSAGNLTSATLPDPDGVGPLTAPVILYGRDPAGTGLLVSQTDADGNVSHYAYDSQHNLVSVTTPLGEMTAYGYDSAGRQTSVVDPRGAVAGCGCAATYTTSFTYDNADLKKSQTDPLGDVTTWTYDPVGNLTATTDANGHSTHYGYDAANELTSVTAPDGTVTSYVYDDDGNLTSRTDANQHTTTHAYDASNRLTGTTDPLSRSWSYGYDANGNQTTVTMPGGGVATSTYDATNRLTQTSYSGGAATPTVTYSYDADGNRTRMVDGAGTITYSYDNLNRLTGTARGTNTFAYGYGPAGELLSRRYPDGTTTSYGYDGDLRLITANSGATVLAYSYDPAGELVQMTRPAANGWAETRSYDPAGRLTQLKDGNGTDTLQQLDYAYDATGDATSLTTLSGVERYSYDNRDRLTGVCYQEPACRPTDPHISYGYDPVGNRLSQETEIGTTSYSYDQADELTGSSGPGGTTSYAYDARGDQTQAGNRSFSYDLAGKTISTAAAGSTTSYSYDGDGNRLTATTAGTTTTYQWDTNGPLPLLATETDATGATLRSYLYGLGPDAAAMTSGGSTYYFHHDRLGSITALTSQSGATERTYSYDPFGNIRTGSQPDPNAPATDLGYLSQLQDPGGVYDLRARLYNPTDGRFLATDPLPAPATSPYTDAYDYAGQDPINGYDLAGTNVQGVGGGAPIWIGDALPNDYFCKKSCKAKHYWRDLIESTAAGVGVFAGPELWVAGSAAARVLSVQIAARLGASAGGLIAAAKNGYDTYSKTTAGPLPARLGAALAGALSATANRAQQIARLWYVIWDAARKYGH
jgi:RHS repeat-associated protein